LIIINFCNAQKIIGFESEEEYFDLLEYASGGNQNYYFDDISTNPSLTKLEVSLFKEKTIDYGKINVNNRIKSLFIYAKSNINKLDSNIFYELSLLKNIKFVHIDFDENFSQKSELFESLSKLESLEGLKFEKLKIESKDTLVLKNIFARLKYLKLNYNTKIPKELTVFENLERLSFSGFLHNNNFEFIKNGISAPKLQALGLSYTLPNETLDKLNLMFPEISEMIISPFDTLTNENYNSLSKFKNLKKLSIYQNIKQINPRISALKNLETLNISYANSILFYDGIKFDFDFLDGLKKLKTLKISNCNKIKINKNNLNFNNLENFTIKNTNYLDFNFDALNANKVRKIVLSNCSLAVVPKKLYSLIKLEILDLSKNQIVKIESGIKSLQSLKYLDISANKILLIPIEVGSLAKIKKININENALTSLPSTMGNLKNLEYLDCNTNFIESLPNTFSQLTTLKHLDLGCNRFDKIPISICKIDNLELLSLSNDCNKIENNRNIARHKADKISFNLPKIKHLDLSPFELDKHSFESLCLLPLDFEFIKIKGLDSLPSCDWKNTTGNILKLGSIKGGKIPNNLFDSNVKVIEMYFNNISYTLKEEVSKKYFKIKIGLLPFESIIKDTSLLLFLAKKRSKNLDDYEMMFRIDSLYAIKNINIPLYVSSLKSKEKFEQALYYTNVYLTDTFYLKSEKDIYNIILEKNNLLRKLHKTDEIIKNNIMLDSIYNYNYSTEIGFYYLSKGNSGDARRYFRKYINEAFYNLEIAKPASKTIEYLNLIEALFLVEDYTKIDSLNILLKNNSTNLGIYKTVFEYLQILRKITLSNFNPDDIISFREQFENKNETDWSCHLISQWSEYFEPIKREKIKMLNQVVCAENDYRIINVNDLKYRSNFKYY
jgi:hypothetical protein